MQSRIKKRLEAYFHQDFGMGVANTIMALSLGVEVMNTTVLGIGERSGNAPMEEIVERQSPGAKPRGLFFPPRAGQAASKQRTSLNQCVSKTA